MDYNEAGRAFKYLVRHIDSSDGKSELRKLLELFNEALKGIKMEDRSSFTNKIVNLLWNIKEKELESVIVILKNKNGFYDIFIFDDKVELPMISLVSSEAFVDMLRRNPLCGSVIENVESDDIVIFLKAYYICRDEVPISSTALNLVPEYSPNCLEMVSIQEKFARMNPMNKLELKNIILYDKEALPYHLGYLDNYKKEIKSSFYQNRFCDILKEVRQDRFLGTSLKKFQR